MDVTSFGKTSFAPVTGALELAAADSASTRNNNVIC